MNASRKRKHLTQDQRVKIHAKCGGKCAYCGCEITLKQMQADHLVPFELGGADEMENLLPSCRSCNHRKNTETIERFRDSIERFESVLARDSVTYKNAVRFRQVIPNPHPVVFYFEREASDED